MYYLWFQKSNMGLLGPSQSVSRAAFLLKALGEKHCLAFSNFQRPIFHHLQRLNHSDLIILSPFSTFKNTCYCTGLTQIISDPALFESQQIDILNSNCSINSLVLCNIFKFQELDVNICVLLRGVRGNYYSAYHKNACDSVFTGLELVEQYPCYCNRTLKSGECIIGKFSAYLAGSITTTPYQNWERRASLSRLL